MEKEKLKTIKKIKKLYSKQLKQMAKNLTDAPDSLLDFVVVYLHYIRDVAILQLPLATKETTSIPLTALMATINEFDEYLNCIANYFIISDMGVVTSAAEDREENLKKYQAELKKHWDTFWLYCKTYFNSWIELII